MVSRLASNKSKYNSFCSIYVWGIRKCQNLRLHNHCGDGVIVTTYNWMRLLKSIRWPVNEIANFKMYRHNLSFHEPDLRGIQCDFLGSACGQKIESIERKVPHTWVPIFHHFQYYPRAAINAHTRHTQQFGSIGVVHDLFIRHFAVKQSYKPRSSANWIMYQIE